MVTWRKEEVDAARHRQRKREARDWKRVEFCQATPISLVDESKESRTGARRTETCVAPS